MALVSRDHKVKVVVDPIIRIDRRQPPKYPDWVSIVLHQELEGSGTLEYDARRIELLFDEGQLTGSRSVKGGTIYTPLKQEGLISSCLDLSDLEEIFSKGREFFAENYNNQMLYAWRSAVIDDRDGFTRVPFITIHQGILLVIAWHYLNLAWGINSPAAMYPTPDPS